MQSEETIVQDLVKKFPYLEGSVIVQRQRRILLSVEMGKFPEVFEYAHSGSPGFVMLCTITGFDEGQKIGLVYHMAREDGVMLNIKTDIPKDNPVMNTVTRAFPGAEIYEREIMDLLGVKVEGLLEGKRYPLSDDWPKDQYPMRKDWKPKENSDA